MSEIVRAQSRYLNGLGDRLDAGKEESILGHYIEEKGWAMKRALEHLKPLAREAHEQASKSERYSKWFAVGCGLAGLLGGSSIGVMGMLPLGTAAIAIVLWNQARTCLPRRAAELKALKTLPELPNIAYFAYQGGATEQQIISAWDLFLDGYQKQKPSGVTGQQIESEFKRLLVAVCSESKPPSFDEYDDDETEGNDAADALVSPTGASNKQCGRCKNFTPSGSEGWGDCSVYPIVPVRSEDSPPKCTSFSPIQTVGTSTKLGAIPTAAIAVAEPTAPPTTYPMAAKEVSKDDRAALIARLNQDCPALVKLIKSHPIRLTGTQRSGKSTIAKILGLLRMVLLPGHGVIAATPHYEPANPYPKVFTVAGVTAQGKRDYAAIERQWFGMADKVESCQQSNISYVWDEFGLFDQAIADTDDDKDKIKRVLTSCLRETMKFGIYPMFIVHGETAAFLPGSKGLVTVFLNSTVRVEAIGEQIEDEMGLPTLRPTGRFNVTYLDGTKDEGKLPDWLTESYLLGLIGDRTPPKQDDPAPRCESKKVELEPDPEDAPEVGMKQPHESTLKQSRKDVFELSQAILELLQSNRDKSYSDEAIRSHRYIREKLGKSPTIAAVRESISEISKLSFIQTNDEGKVQWNQPD